MPVSLPRGENMNINKLTILPMSKHYTSTRIINPDKEVVRQALLKTTQKALGQANNLPDKLIKKLAQERKIPSFVNPKSYVGNKTPVEDIRVMGGVGFDFFG